MKKVFLVIAIVALVLGFFYFDLDRLLTLQGLQEGLDQFETWRAAQPLLVGGAFLLLYVFVTALSLPGATLMSLLGGFLFGSFVGTAAVVMSATIGASIIFIAARTAMAHLR